MNDPFSTTEACIDSRYDFSRADESFGEYGYAYKHVVCNRVKDYPFFAHTIDTILAAHGDREVVIRGVPGDIIDVYLFRIGDVGNSIRRRRAFPAFTNALLTSAVAAYALGWVLKRTRLKVPQPRQYFLGADFVGDPRETMLWREVSDASHSVLVVLRNEAQADLHGRLLGGWSRCVASDGRISLSKLVPILRLLARDMATLYRRGRHLSSEIFWDLIRLPFRRVVCRALFNRFRFENFWARDDYNVEHIIRTQELRRLGGRHFGQLHGIPAYPPVSAQRRYMFFDLYYVFGEALYRRFYADRWPADMQVKAVGSFGLSRGQLVRLKDARPNNILFFIKHSFQDDATFELIRKVAEAFPDRMVYVKPKQKKKEWRQFLSKLERLFSEGPPNLVESKDDSYELMFKGQYCLSDPSSLVAEAIQFGLVSFLLITAPGWKNLYFDEFPHLRVGSAEEVIARIRAIESGKWEYPRAAYRDLIDLSGRVIWDVIREDMGLPPKQREPLPHLRFIDGASETAGEVSAAPLQRPQVLGETA
jgi:hypothetical protein